MKIGDEVIIIGHSRYLNGFPINSIGFIFDIEKQDNGIFYKITPYLKEKGHNWFSYTKDNIKLSNSEIRNKKLNQIL